MYPQQLEVEAQAKLVRGLEIFWSGLQSCVNIHWIKSVSEYSMIELAHCAAAKSSLILILITVVDPGCIASNQETSGAPGASYSKPSGRKKIE